MATTLDLSTFLMKDGYTITQDGSDYVIQYLIEKPEGAAAAAKVALIELKNSTHMSIPIQKSPFIPNYFQGQITALGCGRFALNNLLHYEQFSFNNEYNLPYTVSSVITEHINQATETLNTLSNITPINLQAVCKNYEGVLSKFSAYGLGGKCRPDEFFDGEVLKTALNIIGHRVENARIQENHIQLYTAALRDSTGSVTYTETMPELLGYIVNYNKIHWVCIRKLPETVGPLDKRFQYLNSQYPTDIEPRTFEECVSIIKGNNPTQVYVVFNKKEGVSFITPPAFEIVQSLSSTPGEDINIDGLKKQADAVYGVYSQPDALNTLKSLITTIAVNEDQKKQLKAILLDPDMAFELLLQIVNFPSSALNDMRSKINTLFKTQDVLKNMRKFIKDVYSPTYTFITDAYLTGKSENELLKIESVLAADSSKTITDSPALDAALSKTTTTGGSRRKTLRLQARQKPGRRALTHKQVHHEQNENA
jgi:hypothetical protein